MVTAFVPKGLPETLASIDARLAEQNILIQRLLGAQSASPEQPENAYHIVNLTQPAGVAGGPAQIYQTSDQFVLTLVVFSTDTAGLYTFQVGNDGSYDFYCGANGSYSIVSSEASPIVVARGLPITVIPAAGTPGWTLSVWGKPGRSMGRSS